uniref:Uncharacterized protein n=1 Tax=viral metagenome TaxID=1070528 RepID=A0A6H2A1J7_9ZZZZ
MTDEKIKVTLAEKLVVLVIFGTLAVYSLVKLEDIVAASGFASTVAVYYLSRDGV